MQSQMHKGGLAQQVRNHRVSASVTDDAILNYLQALATPRALTVWLLYSQGEHEQLSELEVQPSSYSDGYSFRDDYLATNFLSKSNFLKIGLSKKAAAMEKFHRFEELCSRTNSRFKNLSLDPLYQGVNARLLNAVVCKIDRILGDYTPDEFIENTNWGPGVTTLLKGEDVSAYNKYQDELGITRDLYALVEPWFSMAFPLWDEHLQTKEKSDESGYFKFQKGNVIVTVPKNSKTDRVIAIEPGINQYFQKSIGSMIRRRLQRHGINLNSQTTNQRLAKESANHGLLATVDFSSASDSISLEVVREIIPKRWLQLMEATRSVTGRDGNNVVRWAKFSSMGNGFTFELETLIFYAAALAVCEECREETYDVSVFGDDVLLPTSCFKLFASFCDFLGFRVNYQKSFFSGYFRESCGEHYFAAIDCKPVFLKERLHNVQSIYKLANSIRLLAHRHNSYHGCDHRFHTCWRHLFDGVPKALRFGIPFGLGDGGFIMNFDEATPSLAGRGFEGYRVRSLIEVGVTRHCDGLGLLLARTKELTVENDQRSFFDIFFRGRSYSERAYKNTYTLRGRTKKMIANLLVHTWYNLGEWT